MVVSKIMHIFANELKKRKLIIICQSIHPIQKRPLFLRAL